MGYKLPSPKLKNVAPASRLEWSFLDSLGDPNFSTTTVAQIRQQLVEAGFQLLPGEEVLSDKRIIIQAHK